jgi:protease-4
MGDVAASGGYYAAAGANEILAGPTTLTGSIGVFMLKPTLQDLYEKIGAGSDAVVGSGRPEILDPYRPWSDEDRALAQKWVDASYSTFVGIVAKGRNLTRESVDQMARGRIWSGADAKGKGLVDGFGGLDAAVARARALAKIPESEKLDTVVFGRERGMLDAEEGLAQVSLPAPEPLPSPLRELASRLDTGAALLSPGVQARMEYDVEVE